MCGPGDRAGDGLRELFRVRGECPKRCLELLLKLVALVGCVFKHCVGIVEGQQRDAAEFLMHLLGQTHLREVPLCVEEERCLGRDVRQRHTHTCATVLPKPKKKKHNGRRRVLYDVLFFIDDSWVESR